MITDQVSRTDTLWYAVFVLLIAWYLIFIIRPIINR